MNARNFIWEKAMNCTAFILENWLLVLVKQSIVYLCDAG